LDVTNHEEVAMSGFEAIDVSRDGAIAQVELTGPGKGNAMGPAVFRELAQAFRDLDRDDAVRVVVVRGRGDHFTYGLDLAAMMADLAPHLLGPQMAAKRTKLHDLIRDLQESMDAVERCRKPTIAAIQGWCIGGGLDLAAACDVRLCSRDAKFSLREVRVAIVADLGSLQRLPPIIGEGLTRELAFTGQDIDADRALQIGLVNSVWPDADALFAAARAMADDIARNPPLVVQGVKQVMNHTARRNVADGLAYVAVWNSAFLQSMDLTEAFTAFREKREPRFRGQ
jgi:enoyl-CoA hydratase